MGGITMTEVCQAIIDELERQIIIYPHNRQVNIYGWKKSVFNGLDTTKYCLVIDINNPNFPLAMRKKGIATDYGLHI